MLPRMNSLTKWTDLAEEWETEPILSSSEREAFHANTGLDLGLDSVVSEGPVPTISPCIERSDSPLMACSLTIIWLGGISSSFLRISFGVTASQKEQVEFWKAGQEVCGGGGIGIG